MQLNKIAAAVLAASFAAGANAALTDRPWNVPAGDLMDVFVSGATAQDTGLATAYAAKCASVGGQLVVFAQNAGTLAVPHASYTSYFCTEKMSYTGMSATKYVLMHKHSAGGSGWGVGPVAGATPISRLNVNLAGCPIDAAINTSSAITAVATVLEERKCNDLDAAVPDIGISDVEPALFNANANLIDAGIIENQGYFPNTTAIPNGSPGTVSTNLSTLATPLATNSLTFGITVTLALRNALQDAQGMTFGADAVNERDLEANAPTLTRAQVASLFTGNIKNWTQFKTAAGANLAGIPVADNRIFICRRSPGSGTQAQFNALFLNDGCANGADSAARDNDEYIAFDDNGDGDYDTGEGYVGSSRLSGFRVQADLASPGGAPALGPVIHENQGSGDVDNCMNHLADAGRWAVGVSSLERGSDKFRFVAVDGVAPTLANVAANKYWDWAGSTLQYRAATSSTFSADDRQFAIGLAGDTNTPTKLRNANTYNIRMYTGLPKDNTARVSGVGGNYVHVGYLATIENGYLPNIPFTTNTPTMSSGRFGNTCKTATTPGNSIMLR